ELCARIRALHRRHSGQEEEILRHGDLILDPSAHTVTIQNSEVSLSVKEFDILQNLMENMGRVMSRRKLSEKIYCLDDDVESNAIEVHIHHLRKKLGEHPIRTVRGVGYVIEKPAGGVARR
ncbi:MAG: winged helix-turn-helix domain-containing protein, partial [Candidatus Thiodiazotropha sp.]